MSTMSHNLHIYPKVVLPTSLEIPNLLYMFLLQSQLRLTHTNAHKAGTLSLPSCCIPGLQNHTGKGNFSRNTNGTSAYHLIGIFSTQFWDLTFLILLGGGILCPLSTVAELCVVQKTTLNGGLPRATEWELYLHFKLHCERGTLAPTVGWDFYTEHLKASISLLQETDVSILGFLGLR